MKLTCIPPVRQLKLTKQLICFSGLARDLHLTSPGTFFCTVSCARYCSILAGPNLDKFRRPDPYQTSCCHPPPLATVLCGPSDSFVCELRSLRRLNLLLLLLLLLLPLRGSDPHLHLHRWQAWISFVAAPVLASARLLQAAQLIVAQIYFWKPPHLPPLLHPSRVPPRPIIIPRFWLH